MKFKLLILPVSLLLAFLVFLYFIQPEWASYFENKNALASKRIDLEDIRNNQNNFSQALKNYNAISGDNKLLINRTIPETILEEDFFYNLNLALNETGAVLKEAKFDQKESRKSSTDSDENLDLKKTEVSLDILGNYFQLRTVLYSMENLDRLVRINEMFIKENIQEKNLNLNLTLTILNRDNFPNLEVDLKDRYLSSILKNGLDLELVDNYKEYRGGVSSFDFIGENVSGKEDLFDSTGGSEIILDSENEGVTAEEIQEASPETVE